MSFCTSLRRRASCSNLVPILKASPLNLRENKLKTHDMEILMPTSASVDPLVPIATPSKKGRSLAEKKVMLTVPLFEAKGRWFRIIFLTESTIMQENLQPTLARLQHFDSLTGGVDCAILFLLPSSISAENVNYKEMATSCFATPMHGYAQLQVTLLESNLRIPLLPLMGPASLPRTVQLYTGALNAKKTTPKQPTAVRDLVPHCTGNAPMKADTFTTITDQFACLRDLADMDEEEGLENLVEAGLDREEAGNCVEFWEMEWVVD